MKTNKHNSKESIIIKEFIPGPFVFRLRSIDSCHAASTSQLPQTKVKKKYYNLLIFSLTWVPFKTIQRNEKNYPLKQNEIKSEIYWSSVSSMATWNKFSSPRSMPGLRRQCLEDSFSKPLSW